MALELCVTMYVTLCNRPDVESLWYVMSTVMGGYNPTIISSSGRNHKVTDRLTPAEIKREMDSLNSHDMILPKASSIRSLALTAQQFMDIW